MSTSYGELSPHTAAWVTKEMLKLAEPILARFGQMMEDPVDPALREQQDAIRKQITKLKQTGWARIHPDRIPSLQGQCAIIGHVPSVIKGPDREVCFYCGAKIE